MKRRKLIIIGSLIFLIIVCTIFFSSTGSEENKIVETTSNTAEVSDAIVTIYGNTDLQDGKNKIIISVTAVDGSVRNYRIYVTK